MQAIYVILNFLVAILKSEMFNSISKITFQYVISMKIIDSKSLKSSVFYIYVVVQLLNCVLLFVTPC